MKERNAQPLIIRLLALLFAVALLAAGAAGCKKEEQPAGDDRLEITDGAGDAGSAGDTGGDGDGQQATDPAPSGPTQPEPSQGEPSQGESGQGAPGTLEVLDTVAYALDGMLYGGVAYRNAGSAPIQLSAAVFTFSVNGGTQQNEFTPVEAYDVVLPGETAYCTLMTAYEREGEPGGEVALAAELRAQTTERAQRPLTVSSAMLIQNYPGFPTLSGRLQNASGEAVDLAMVYVGFYDENEKLIGVWYFPYNALLQPGDGTPFVVHMRALPIPNLAARTAGMRFRAYSM